MRGVAGEEEELAQAAMKAADEARLTDSPAYKKTSSLEPSTASGKKEDDRAAREAEELAEQIAREEKAAAEMAAEDAHLTEERKCIKAVTTTRSH